MKKLLVLYAIFAIISSADTDIDNCKTDFSDYLKNRCISLSPSGSNIKTKCVYDGNDCKEEYTSCDGYKPQSGFSDSICTSINPLDSTKKCVVKNTNAKTCEEADKVCSDGNNDPIYCPYLNAGDDKRCVYFPDTGECKAHYSDCNKVTTIDTDCKNNIPEGHLYKCVWDSSNPVKCQSSLRTCEDGVVNFIDKNNEVERTCIDLDAGTDKRCVLLSDGKTCEAHYSDCTKVTTIDTDCKNNIPEGHLYKCVWDSAEPIKCQRTLRTCEDGVAVFTDKNYEQTRNCLDLSAGEGQRCILSNSNKCEAHYEECSNAPKESCLTNIPKDPTKNCGLNSAGNACEDKNRKCEDGLSIINEKNPDKTKTCFDLSHGDNQRCILFEDGTCKTHYNNCDDITEQSDCNANYPITGKDKKCIWSKKLNSNDYECKDSDRYCEDFIINYYDRYSGDLINSYTKNCVNELTSKDDNKVCMLENNENCVSYYSSCSVGNNDKNLCSNIKPLNLYKSGFKANYKCSYDDKKNTCNEVKKECSEFDKEKGDTCSQLDPLSAYKQCVYDTNKKICESKYTKCESYNSDVEESKRDPDACQNIILDQNIPYKYCVYDTSKKLCETKTKPCSSLKTKQQCHSQIFEDDDNKRCLFLENGNCVESLKDCSNTGANVNKTFCEQIEPTRENNNGKYNYFNCTFIEKNNVKSCTKMKIECEYYKERLKEDHICEDLTGNIDDGKTYCSFENNKCVSKYTNCEKYEGNDENICKSILDEDNSDKCVLNDQQKCITQKKSCSEYKGMDSKKCENYKPSSNDKRCVLVDNNCIEQFKTCALYESQTQIDQKTCESIRNYDTSKGEYYPTYLCKWSAPAQGQTKGKCTATKIGCNEFNPDYYKTGCGSGIADYYNKCVYNNKVCSTKAKTCKELDYFPTLSSEQAREVCKNRETSSGNLMCEANEDSDGCIEKEKPKNSSAEIKLCKIILTLLFCLLA